MSAVKEYEMQVARIVNSTDASHVPVSTYKKYLNNQQVTNEQIAALMIPCRGNLSKIARTLGTCRSTISRRVTASNPLQAKRDEAKATMRDVAEEALEDKIINGDLTAIIFYLKTQCGYKETDVREHLDRVEYDIEIRTVDISNGLTQIAPRSISDSEAPGED